MLRNLSWKLTIFALTSFFGFKMSRKCQMDYFLSTICFILYLRHLENWFVEEINFNSYLKAIILKWDGTRVKSRFSFKIVNDLWSYICREQSETFGLNQLFYLLWKSLNIYLSDKLPLSFGCFLKSESL